MLNADYWWLNQRFCEWGCWLSSRLFSNYQTYGFYWTGKTNMHILHIKHWKGYFRSTMSWFSYRTKGQWTKIWQTTLSHTQFIFPYSGKKFKLLHRKYGFMIRSRIGNKSPFQNILLLAWETTDKSSFFRVFMELVNKTCKYLNILLCY